MNFGKLLASGKSFVNGRAEISYRTNKQIYLPKFESPKNPFNKIATSCCGDHGGHPQGPPIKKEIVAAKTQKLPTLSAASKQAPNWTSKLNPISMLRQTAETKNE